MISDNNIKQVNNGKQVKQSILMFDIVDLYAGGRDGN
jgi:hypothetical protein